jgi:hypothetical protein
MSLQKNPRYENRKLLDLANGMACQGCGREDGTIVMAHSNKSIHGKAKGMKAHDCFVAALCHACHYWIDFGARDYLIWSCTPDHKLEFFRRASESTMLHLWREGKIKVV